jgi:hypothetical protein
VRAEKREKPGGWFTGNPPGHTTYYLLHFYVPSQTPVILGTKPGHAGHAITVFHDSEVVSTSGRLMFHAGFNVLVVKLYSNGNGAMQLSLRGRGIQQENGQPRW